MKLFLSFFTVRQCFLNSVTAHQPLMLTLMKVKSINQSILFCCLFFSEACFRLFHLSDS